MRIKLQRITSTSEKVSQFLKMLIEKISQLTSRTEKVSQFLIIIVLYIRQSRLVHGRGVRRQLVAERAVPTASLLKPLATLAT